jgi:hypothetical protein
VRGTQYANDNYYLLVTLLYVYMRLYYATQASLDYSCVCESTGWFMVMTGVFTE